MIIGDCESDRTLSLSMFKVGDGGERSEVDVLDALVEDDDSREDGEDGVGEEGPDV